MTFLLSYNKQSSIRSRVDEFRIFAYLWNTSKHPNFLPLAMEPFQTSMLFHFIGIGFIFTALVGGWMLNAVYDRAGSYQSKLIILTSLRRIGLLSPVAIVVLLLSGGANMHFAGYALSSTPWLSTKIILFLIAAIVGMIFGARGSKRTILVSALADDSAHEGAEAKLQALDRQQRLFYLFQSILLFAILILSVFKPW